jgi:glutamate--cysteine ligase
VPPPRRAGAAAGIAVGVNPAKPWLRAARFGPADPVIGRAAAECFAAADAALARSQVPAEIRTAVSDFAERYVLRGRCPADDLLDSIGSRKGMS